MLIWETARASVEHWLFAPRGPLSPRERARRFAQYPYALTRDLLGGRLNFYAMGLVYATLLALVPLIAFSFALLKGFGAHRELEPLIYEFFRPMGDAAGELTEKVMDFADHVRTGIVGTVGLAFLIWTLIGTLKKVEDAVNYVWHVEVARSFVRRIAEYVALLVVAPILIGTLVGTAHITAANKSVSAITHIPALVAVGHGLLALAPVAIVSCIFTIVYALVPNTRVRLVPALIGGITAGIAWAVVGQLFAAFVLLSTRLAIVYAGFAIFIAALIWIYFGWLILLSGAQLSFYVQNPSYLRVGLREPRLSNAETEQLALSIMYLVARSHLRGGKRWSIGALAAELSLPGVAVTRSIDALEAAGLLVTTDDEMLLPARDAGYIPLTDIVSVARTAYSVHGDDRYVAPKPVAKLFAEFEGGWREQLGKRTLEAWVIETT